MALNAFGQGAAIIQTFPGSGTNFTQNNEARIKVLTYSNWLPTGIAGNWVPTSRVNPVPSVSNNEWTATSANGSGALDNYNPNAYLSGYGWECRRQTIDYLSGTNTGPDIFGSSFSSMSYKITTSIYWQGSETGNCGGISGTINESNFLNAVTPSAVTPDPNCGQSPDVYCTWDLWCVHIQISTDLQGGSVSLFPEAVMVTIYDDPTLGGTGKVLNSLAGINLAS
tara:strand:- start:485 stop:1159 length:675 start_codon:yes stop_codon:yes gene_type:complete